MFWSFQVESKFWKKSNSIHNTPVCKPSFPDWSNFSVNSEGDHRSHLAPGASFAFFVIHFYPDRWTLETTMTMGFGRRVGEIVGLPMHTAFWSCPLSLVLSFGRADMVVPSLLPSKEMRADPTNLSCCNPLVNDSSISPLHLLSHA